MELVICIPGYKENKNKWSISILTCLILNECKPFKYQDILIYLDSALLKKYEMVLGFWNIICHFLLNFKYKIFCTVIFLPGLYLTKVLTHAH